MVIEIMSKERLEERIREYIERMPSLPTTVTKVLQICNSPSTSPNDLNKVISLDPVLTGQILKLINSAYYNLPTEVTSLARAIIMIGINTVKNLVLSTAVLKKLGSKDSFQALNMDAFWTHSLGVGVTAKLMAASIGVPPDKREEYFVAGLLHDLGKIPLNNQFPEEYTKVMEIVKVDQLPLHEAEDFRLELSHCAAGKIIAEKWKLGGGIYDAIVYHHNPAEADAKNLQLTSIVALANNYVNELELGDAGDILWDRSMSTEIAN
ncbi:MAG: HDOD domain-containing protein, partial [bacterium]|nr:HDOD domain-containing protein [bacterium]